MKMLGNILWHFPFFGFISAAIVYLFGLLFTATVIAAPVGLGLMEFGKFLLAPFGHAMVSKSDLNIDQNKAWKTYSTIVMVLYFPLGLFFTIVGIFQVVGLCLSIFGIPVALVIAKSLGTYLNPVNKKCVSSAVAAELERRKGQAEVEKYLDSGDSVICPKCGTPNPSGAKFCKNDGYCFDSVAEKPDMAIVSAASAPVVQPPSEPILPTDDSVICPKCGTPNPRGAKFCKKDGYCFDSVAEKPDMAIVSAASAPVVQPPSEPILPTDDSVICPKCSTPNLSSAKFCKKDGYPLQAGVATPQAIPVAKTSPVAAQPAKSLETQPSAAKISTTVAAGKSRRGWMIGALAGVVLLAGVGGGYSYWAGYIGNRQGDVQDTINAELGTHGLGNIKVTIDREWGASLSGTVLSQADKDQALELIRGHKELKKIAADLVHVQPSAADLEKSLNKALADGGFSTITAQIDKDLVATLRGVAESPDQKAQALSLAAGMAGLNGIRDDVQEVMTSEYEDAQQALPPEMVSAPEPQAPAPKAVAPTHAIDKAALERELNALLRSNGVGRVMGRVNPDMSVVLSGTVRSVEERDSAINIGEAMPGLNALHDNIQVVALQVVKLATPQAPQVSIAIDPAKMEGDINRALRSRDINSVTAQVNDDMSLTLKGSASEAEKERALQLARQVRGVRGIKDKIFVVE